MTTLESIFVSGIFGLSILLTVLSVGFFARACRGMWDEENDEVKHGGPDDTETN